MAPPIRFAEVASSRSQMRCGKPNWNARSVCMPAIHGRSRDCTRTEDRLCALLWSRGICRRDLARVACIIGKAGKSLPGPGNIKEQITLRAFADNFPALLRLTQSCKASRMEGFPAGSLEPEPDVWPEK